MGRISLLIGRFLDLIKYSGSDFHHASIWVLLQWLFFWVILHTKKRNQVVSVYKKFRYCLGLFFTGLFCLKVNRKGVQHENFRGLNFYDFYRNGNSASKEGDFPEGVLENLRSQGIGEFYGDPGWMKKIENLKGQNSRNIQSEFNLPVLLGKYSGSTTYFNESEIDDLLFGNNPTGSMKDYFDEISYGNLLVDGTVGGWYQSSLNQSQAVENVR